MKKKEKYFNEYYNIKIILFPLMYYYINGNNIEK